MPKLVSDNCGLDNRAEPRNEKNRSTKTPSEVYFCSIFIKQALLLTSRSDLQGSNSCGSSVGIFQTTILFSTNKQTHNTKDNITKKFSFSFHKICPHNALRVFRSISNCEKAATGMQIFFDFDIFVILKNSVYIPASNITYSCVCPCLRGVARDMLAISR